MKSKASQEKKRELAKKFCHAVAELMENNREMGAFCIRYPLAQTDKDDEIGGFLADVCYNVNDIDPLLKIAGLNKEESRTLSGIFLYFIFHFVRIEGKRVGIQDE